MNQFIHRANSFIGTSLLFTLLMTVFTSRLSSATEIEKPFFEIKTSDLAALTEAFDNIILANERPFYGAMLLVQDGEVVYQYKHGFQGMEQPDSNSYFLLASQSKMVTAAVVLNAVDEGKISLDQTLNHYLKLANKPLYHLDITIKQLLSHTSGIAPVGKNNRFTPGSQFQYSNLGYEMLATVLEIQYQRPFSTLVNLFLLDKGIDGILAQIGPIKARANSQYKGVQGMAMRPDSPPDGVDNQMVNYEMVDYEITADLLPGGGLLGSANGLAQYLQALHGGLLLPKGLYQAMVTPVIKRSHRWRELYYGYGMQINQLQLMEYSHSGYLPGFQSLSLSYPQNDTYFVLLENSSWPLDDMDKVFGLHDRLRAILRQHLILTLTDKNKP
ncbi:serine hydrolase domain-containing protein [Shewanella psychrotolerans]|uniref:serine hydrolase domain-containing protein n=1 Tax=Shewanella psychrotolerans TaxID=2864206 RepID=UPI001C66240B|nr:serine hydrolase domain-containing protein [Shewanella psychrotolerans]QYK02279.1 beta-lactamase family protein [Shewanella psychrotolerans]